VRKAQIVVRIRTHGVNNIFNNNKSHLFWPNSFQFSKSKNKVTKLRDFIEKSSLTLISSSKAQLNNLNTKRIQRMRCNLLILHLELFIAANIWIHQKGPVCTKVKQIGICTFLILLNFRSSEDYFIVSIFVKISQFWTFNQLRINHTSDKKR